MPGRRISKPSYARHPPIRSTAACGILAALVLGALASACREPPPRLVLVLCIDTLRADHVSANGYQRETTPTLDLLARRGVRFARAYTTSSWTVPAVASLLTSREVFEHGAGIPGDVKHLSSETVPVHFPTELPSVAELLANRGIDTALFSANPFLYGRYRDGFAESSVERVDAAHLVDRVLGWLDRGSEAPRFAHVQFMDVHQPNRPPEPYFSWFPAGDSPRTPAHGDWSFGRLERADDPEFERFRAHRVAAYDGAIRYVDAQISRLLSGLEERGLDDRTLIIVTSDHGEEFWDHALVQARWGDDPRGIWGIGHGHTLFEEQLRIPLIVAGAGVEPRAASPCVASILDVAPTVMDAFGQPIEPGFRGRSLLATGATDDCAERELYAGSIAYGPASSSVLARVWKLTVRGDRAPTLFDLEADPAEANDLALRQPQVASRLNGRLERIRRPPPVGEPRRAPIDSESARELRALGYL